MKKQYLKISLAAFFFAALIFGTSCSKKSSDSVTPATTPPAAATKPAAPNTEKRKSVDAEDGTGRPPLTDTPVGVVTVKDQQSQRNDGMIQENQTKLDNLTGKGTTQGRFESSQGTTVFGWFISDFTVDGYSYTDQQIYDNGLQQALFFNIDSSGYYWAFENKSKTWSWGTYGIDKGMTTLAIDFDSSWTPTETYKIAKITEDRLVLTLNYVDKSRNIHNTIIGLNGYDLSNEKYNGETEISAEEKVFVGKWNWQVEDTSANYVSKNPITDVLINSDGTYSLEQKGSATSYGSWIIETVSGSSNGKEYYLYAAYYDEKQLTVIIEAYRVKIQGLYMEMTLIDTTSQADLDNIGSILTFKKY